MSTPFRTRESLIEAARRVVADVAESECPISGACIVSSLAAGDFTPESDVDILLVAVDDAGKPGIFRRLIDGTIFEWVVLPRDYLRDVDTVLADAGLCHDILDALILFDPDGRLEDLRRDVKLRYREPRWIWVRTKGQLQRVVDAIELMRSRLEQDDILLAQRAHVSVVKGLFGVPRALLNRRCTMARASLFCREAAYELGWSDYPDGVADLLGSAGLAEAEIVRLRSVALRTIDATDFSEPEKAIRIRFLDSCDWLLANALPSDAVWPLYFWSSTAVEQSGGRSNPLVWKHWRELANALGVGSRRELLRRKECAEQMQKQAEDLVQAHRSRLGM